MLWSKDFLFLPRNFLTISRFLWSAIDFIWILRLMPEKWSYLKKGRGMVRKIYYRSPERTWCFSLQKSLDRITSNLLNSARLQDFKKANRRQMLYSWPMLSCAKAAAMDLSKIQEVSYKTAIFVWGYYKSTPQARHREYQGTHHSPKPIGSPNTSYHISGKIIMHIQIIIIINNNACAQGHLPSPNEFCEIIDECTKNAPSHSLEGNPATE